MSALVAKVVEVVPEAPHAVTLRMDLRGVPFHYRPGQFILIDPHQFALIADTVRANEEKSGKRETVRAYSLASDGLDPRHIEISVKDNPAHGPYAQLLSPVLVHGSAPGLEIAFEGPRGRYCLPEAPPEGVTGIVHVCAGSGVAPNRGMIRHALGKGWPQRHLLLLQNKTAADVFYKREWEQLLAEHPDKLRIRHCYSVDAKEHVDLPIARAAMEGWIDGASALGYVCGPTKPRGNEPGFVESWGGSAKKGIRGNFEALGIAPGRIITEQW